MTKKKIIKTKICSICKKETNLKKIKNGICRTCRSKKIKDKEYLYKPKIRIRLKGFKREDIVKMLLNEKLSFFISIDDELMDYMFENLKEMPLLLKTYNLNTLRKKNVLEVILKEFLFRTKSSFKKFFSKYKITDTIYEQLEQIFYNERIAFEDYIAHLVNSLNKINKIFNIKSKKSFMCENLNKKRIKMLIDGKIKYGELEINYDENKFF